MTADLSWAQLIKLAESHNTSERKDAVVTACGRVERGLRGIGLYELRLPSGEGPTLQTLAKLLLRHLGDEAPDILAAVRLRNALAHDPSLNASCESALTCVHTCRNLLRRLAARIAEEAESDSAEGRASVPDLESRLDARIVRLLRGYAVSMNDLDTMFDSLATLDRQALDDLLAEGRHLRHVNESAAQQFEWLANECLAPARLFWSASRAIAKGDRSDGLCSLLLFANSVPGDQRNLARWRGRLVPFIEILRDEIESRVEKESGTSLPMSYRALLALAPKES